MLEGPGAGDLRCSDPEGLGKSKMGRAAASCSRVDPGPPELWAVGRSGHLRPLIITFRQSSVALGGGSNCRFYFDTQTVPLGSPTPAGHCQPWMKVEFFRKEALPRKLTSARPRGQRLLWGTWAARRTNGEHSRASWTQHGARV